MSKQHKNILSGLLGFGLLVCVVFVGFSLNRLLGLQAKVAKLGKRLSGESSSAKGSVDETTDLSRVLDRLEGEITATRKRFQNHRNLVRKQLWKGMEKKGTVSLSVEDIMPLAHQAYEEGSREHYRKKRGDNSRRSTIDFDSWIKKKLTNVLDLEPSQTDVVKKEIQGYRRKKGTLLNKFTKKHDNPSEYQLTRLEEELNRLYGDHLDKMKYELTDAQYERYLNWRRSGSTIHPIGQMPQPLNEKEQLRVENHGTRLDLKKEERKNPPNSYFISPPQPDEE